MNETDNLNKKAKIISSRIFDILNSEFDKLTVLDIIWNTNIYGEISKAVVKEWQIKDAEQNKDVIKEKAKGLKWIDTKKL